MNNYFSFVSLFLCCLVKKVKWFFLKDTDVFVDYFADNCSVFSVIYPCTRFYEVFVTAFVQKIF